LLNPKHNHHPSLTAFTKDIDDDAMKKRGALWAPDFIGYVKPGVGQDFKQIAVWSLKGRVIEFVGAPGELKEWDDFDDMINFSAFHNGSTIGPPLDDFGVVRLRQGHPKSGKEYEFKLNKNKKVRLRRRSSVA
jgi:hypothetical protein